VKLTLYTDNSHDSWTRTYNNAEVWDWLFGFSLGGGIPGNTNPVLTFTSPANNASYAVGSNFSLTGSANDAEDGALSGASLVWSSDISGVLGTGTSLNVTPVLGLHQITLAATDSQGGRTAITRSISIYRSSAYSIVTDLGSPGLASSGSINNVSAVNGSISTVIANDGSSTGLTIAITDSFAGINEAGVDDSSLYPASAQRDTMYVDRDGDTRAELTIRNLNPALTYDLVFFASRTASDSRDSKYTVGAASVVLNAANNTNQSVRLNDLSPSASGTLVLVIEPTNAARYGYLGVFEIIAHTPSGGGGGGEDVGPSIGNISITLHGTCDLAVTSISLGGSTVTPSAGTFQITATIPDGGINAELIARTNDGRERRIPIDANATVTASH
jgi:hypothetical protein